MKERSKRLAITAVLTLVDIVVFDNYGTEIWQVCAQTPLAKAAFIVLLSLWGGSATVLWLDVDNNLVEARRERDAEVLFGPESTVLRRKSDV